MKRRSLGLIVRGMWLLLILVFLGMLFASLGIQQNGGDEYAGRNTQQLFEEIAPSETKMRRFNGQRVWVTRVSAEQAAQLKQMDSYVQSANAGCDLDQAICMISATSIRDGIEIVFSRQAPANLPADLPWSGGFIDPANGRVFDLLGRAYKPNANRVELNVVRLP